MSEWNQSSIEEFLRQMDETRRAYDALYKQLQITSISTHMLNTLQMDQRRLLEEGLRLQGYVTTVEIGESLYQSINVMKDDFRQASAYYHEMLEKIRRAEEWKRRRRIRLEKKLEESSICTRPLLHAKNKTCGGSLSIIESQVTVDAVCDSCKWQLKTWPPELYRNLAKEYYVASEKLENGFPRDFLLIHSIELSLKALSRQVMYPPNEEGGKGYPYDAYWGVVEPRMTHDLKLLWREVPEAIRGELEAKQVGGRFVKDAIYAIPDKACMSLRYADPPIEQSIDDLDALAKCLLDRVRLEILNCR